MAVVNDNTAVHTVIEVHGLVAIAQVQLLPTPLGNTHAVPMMGVTPALLARAEVTREPQLHASICCNCKPDAEAT